MPGGIPERWPSRDPQALGLVQMLFDRYRQGCVKRAHAVVSTPLFAVGVLLALYGVFALTYNGDGGSTTVTLTGHQLDAHLVGGVSVAIGLIVVGLGIWIARGRSLGS